ncbi:MAG: HD domain-containing protein [Candidatus Omnitrophica bacterium]|nr:HD domain-containing protein [Candidatus Omnitrophota bacterium]
MSRLNLAFFKSFRMKVTVLFVLSLLAIGAISNVLIYRYTLDTQFEDLRAQLMMIAQTASLTVDGDMLIKIPLVPEGVNTAEYKIIAAKLKKIKDSGQLIRYIYTMTKTEKEGIWQFMVDPVPPTKEESRFGISSLPGDKYDATRFPEMLQAFKSPSADKHLAGDEWGTVLSGYAPVFDKTGKAVAVLGIDTDAQTLYSMQREITRRLVFISLLALLFALVIGFFFSRQISDPVKKLVAGTHHVADGDLKYEVRVKGANEFNELAQSFNMMAQSLQKSRDRLQDYFYRVVQSLARIMEARDKYTRGHSERVAEFSGKIAEAIGTPPEKIALLKNIALLHDIGKLGVQEDILNKHGKLTDEEWETIKKHPLIGEDIVKPVSLDKEMIDIIRGHHERYDGKGYPDSLSGNDISVLSQILSVADAYDAMTSTRAYRDAFTKEQAVAEIKKNSGIQFNPDVVAAFRKAKL